MIPQWFDLLDIPFDKMWPDDRYWLPLFLNNNKFTGQFLFDQLGADNILDFKLTVVEEL